MIETFGKEVAEKSVESTEKKPNIEVNSSTIEKELQSPNIEKNLENKTENFEKEKNENDYEINTRNSALEGEKHPETGVEFERREVETDEGIKEGVFPKFEPVDVVNLPEDLYKESDRNQFDYCNQELKNRIANNPELREKFTTEQLEQINDNETPDGYTWHHSEVTGRMELVDSDIHARTGHTGGKNIWGGGTENR